MSKLTERQRKLADGVQAGMTQRDAAIAAGYSPKSAEAQAAQQLKNPKVTDYMASNLKNDPLIADRDARLQFLTRVMRGEEKETIVEFGKDGQKIEILAVPAMKTRLAAVDQLNKMGGDYTERHAHEHSGGVTIGFKFVE